MFHHRPLGTSLRLHPVGQANEDDGHQQGDDHLNQHEFRQPKVVAFNVDDFFGFLAGQRDSPIGWRQEFGQVDVGTVLDVPKQMFGGEKVFRVFLLTLP